MKKRVYFITKAVYFIDSGERADAGHFGFMPHAYSTITAAEKALEKLIKTDRKVTLIDGETHTTFGKRKWPELNLVECFEIKSMPLLDEHDQEVLDNFYSNIK